MSLEMCVIEGASFYSDPAQNSESSLIYRVAPHSD